MRGEGLMQCFVMLVLALGLLVTQSAAATLNRHECATLSAYFNICAHREDKDEPCMLADSGYKWLRKGRHGTDAIHARLHPEDPHRLKEDDFANLCMAVCYEEMTAQQAYHQVCRRPATDA